MQCSVCKSEIPAAKPNDITTGYGYDGDKQPVCFPCCGKADEDYMRENGRNVLYLSGTDATGWKVSNWPGSFSLVPYRVRKSRHNIGRWRYDVWFRWEGGIWHGVNIGDNQILRVKRTKQK